MNESNGPVNTNNASANPSTNTGANTGMNPSTNLNTKLEVKKPENEVKKLVVLNNNINNNTKTIEKSKTSFIWFVVVLLILVVGGYYINKNRNNRVSEEQPVSAAPAITIPGHGFTTDAATDITATSANLHATIAGIMDMKHLNGQSTYFKYGTSATNPSTLSSFTSAIEGEFTTTVTGLQPETTYYYRVVINHGPESKSPQREYGEILSFTTLAQ